MFKNKLKDLKKLILIRELTAEKAAWSVACALGSIFLPLPGVQLIAVLPLCFILRLNIPIVYVVNWINNPLTIAPITFFSYWCGAKVLKIISFGYEPETKLEDESDILDKVDLTQYQWSALWDLQWSEVEWHKHWDFLESLLIPYLTGSFLLLFLIPILTYRPILYLIKKLKKE